VIRRKNIRETVRKDFEFNELIQIWFMIEGVPPFEGLKLVTFLSVT